jgi:hypothetical protein
VFIRLQGLENWKYTKDIQKVDFHLLLQGREITLKIFNGGNLPRVLRILTNT